jgi:lipoate-protein ligase A
MLSVISTVPASGAENMAYDLQTLNRLASEGGDPILRFFRWNAPGASYGKHQSPEALSSQIPIGYPSVRRPTGGGLVLHGEDLCLSLCWRSGQPPIPPRVRDQYPWIHRIILETLSAVTPAKAGAQSIVLAECRDCSLPAAFDTRSCFREPVVYDLLLDGQKIAGGALCRQRDVFLYQGSIQNIPTAGLELSLRSAFQRAFQNF